jgi:hypothetical protein
MTRAEREALIAAVGSAYRERDRDGAIRAHPAWADLGPEDRAAAFEAALELRALEAALDPEGLSTTARAVLARIAQSRG